MPVEIIWCDVLLYHAFSAGTHLCMDHDFVARSGWGANGPLFMHEAQDPNPEDSYTLSVSTANLNQEMELDEEL